MGNIIGPDISFYQDNDETQVIVDFQKMRSNGAEFVIIRAGQNSWPDPDFAQNWKMAKQAGLPRGSYWFYDSRTDPAQQASLWISNMKGDLGELPLWADFEENYGGPFAGWNNWVIFLNTVRSLAPDHEIGIYTNYYYWRERVPVNARGQFSTYPLWIANYNPGAPLIPEPWTTWMFHQFTDQGPGVAFGAESNRIDLNYFNGDLAAFRARFDLSETPTIPENPTPIDVKKVTHRGVEAHIIERFGAKCIVHIIDPVQARVYVTPGGFRTVSAAIQKYGAQLGTNGGGWPNVQTPGHRSNEIWASDGLLVQATALDDRGYINIDALNKPVISKNSKLMTGIRNAWGFDRILGENGVFNSKISDRYTKDARTGAGVTADGKLIILSAEGNDRYQHGLSFPEMWEVLEEFGAIIAGNCDGGSSSAVVNLALSKNSLIVPSDGVQANVINQVLVFAEPVDIPPTNPDEEPMTDIFLKVTTEQKERVAPSMYNPTSRAGQVSGTIIVVPAKVPADLDLKDNLIKDTDSRSDALFVKTSSGWYQPAFYQGKWFMVEVADPNTPEEPDPTPNTTVDVAIVVKDAIGNKIAVNKVSVNDDLYNKAS